MPVSKFPFTESVSIKQTVPVHVSPKALMSGLLFYHRGKIKSLFLFSFFIFSYFFPVLQSQPGMMFRQKSRQIILANTSCS